MNSTRVCWGMVYSFLGILLLVFFFVTEKPNLNLLNDNFTKILWSLSWSAIGIGLGLWNSRRDKNSEGINQRHRHYFTYFLFVWFMAAVSAFVALADTTPRSYAVATLTGMIVGFGGDKLAGALGLNRWL